MLRMFLRRSAVLKFVLAVFVCLVLRTLFLLNHNYTHDKLITNRNRHNVPNLQGLLYKNMTTEDQDKLAQFEEIPQYIQNIDTVRKTITKIEVVRQQVEKEFQNVKNRTFEDVDRVVSRLVISNDRCGNITRPVRSNYSSTGNYWHYHRNGNQHIMVISAFYDDRAVAGILPHIRLQVVATHVVEKHYCYVWYTGLSHPHVIEAEIKSTGRGEKLFGVKYGQWLYSCTLPSSLPIPTHVSLVTHPCETPATIVPIYVPVRSQWEHEFGICVAIAFGSVDAAIIVEWIELNRLFGVTEFNIYNASMSDSMNEIFSVYEKSGLLRVHQMPPPVPDYSKRGSKLSSPTSLNDCMLRNMYRYRFMIVIDFDEFIMPRLHSNYSQMLDAVNKENKLKQHWHSYTFRNAFFFLDSPQEEKEPKYLTTLRYQRRSKPSGYLYAAKSFIDPRMCLSMFNHYCWIRFPAVTGKMTIDVSTQNALSHHYRRCNLGKQVCDEQYKGAEVDRTAVKYKNLISSRVSKVLEGINYFKITS